MIKKQKVESLTIFFSLSFMIPKKLYYLDKAMGKDSTSPKHMLQE